MRQKAKRFNNHESAAKILKEKDPAIKKKLSNRYILKVTMKMFGDETAWK